MIDQRRSVPLPSADDATTLLVAALPLGSGYGRRQGKPRPLGPRLLRADPGLGRRPEPRPSLVLTRDEFEHRRLLKPSTGRSTAVRDACDTATRTAASTGQTTDVTDRCHWGRRAVPQPWRTG